jgi:hypothetical protein
MSHWFGPSAIGRNREIAASLAILASFSGASAVGSGAHVGDTPFVGASRHSAPPPYMFINLLLICLFIYIVIWAFSFVYVIFHPRNSPISGSFLAADPFENIVEDLRL